MRLGGAKAKLPRGLKANIPVEGSIRQQRDSLVRIFFMFPRGLALGNVDPNTGAARPLDPLRTKSVPNPSAASRPARGGGGAWQPAGSGSARGAAAHALA